MYDRANILHDHPTHQRMIGLPKLFVIIDIVFKNMFKTCRAIDKDNEHLIVERSEFEMVGSIYDCEKGPILPIDCKKFDLFCEKTNELIDKNLKP